MSTFSTIDSTINSFYLAFYGRPADPAGLKFWSKALADNNGDAGTIIGAFATSQEAQTRFGSDTVSARITDIYEQLFNRAPDAAGLDFWTKAVEQGNATLAEVSLAILKGAQSSDLDLSTLRQKAADAFTAAVEDGSTEYSGYASIEAARVLVRAVTADATDADLASLVKAAVSFADTATKTPKVVEAIATGSTLLNLYDSARGLKDPVALTQALADTAKAAAGDPVTLESLLRGGGMDKVLKVMPAKATLTDVVEALAKGGLPAAVEVVYPTAPTAPVVIPTPVPVPEKTFFFSQMDHTVAISGTATDKVMVDLTSDVILRGGQQPIYSMNDIQSVLAKDYAGKVTVIGKAAEIYVAMGDAPVSGVSGYEIIDDKSAIFTGEPGARAFLSPRMESLLASVASVKLNGVLSMEERALFNNLRGFDTEKLVAVVDNIAPAMPTIALVKDDGFDPNDGVTSVAKLAVNGLEKAGGTIWQYSIDNGASWNFGGTNNDSGKAELDLSGMHFEGTKVQVRQLDAAGNIGLVSNSVTFTILPAQEQQPEPTFGVGGLGGSISIYGTSTDSVVVNLTADTITRKGNLLPKDNIDITNVHAVNYAGNVMVDGTASEIGAIASGFAAHNIKGYGIIDVKAAIFSGERGERSFASDELANLISNAKYVKLSDTLSIEERALFDNLPGFDTEMLEVNVDNMAPGKPVVALASDTGIDGDLITASGDIKISGLESGNLVEFRTSANSGWTSAGHADGMGNAVVQISGNGDKYVEVRQIDAAGNQSDGTVLTFKLDPNPPTATAPQVPVAPSFQVELVEEGLAVTSNMAGTLTMDNTSRKFDLASIDGPSSAQAGTTIVGAQQDPATGYFEFAFESGVTQRDSTGRIYSFGSNGDDTAGLMGQYVWGFDGNDIIDGRRTGDYLSGGDGNDLIFGYEGADRIIGGAGADFLDLGEDFDNDTVVIGRGDTAIDLMLEDGLVSIAQMDRIVNFRLGDKIELSDVPSGNPVTQETFLTDATSGHYAVVRGDSKNGTFAPDDFGYSYLFQWADGKHVNTVILENLEGVPQFAYSVMNEGPMTVTLVGVNEGGGIPG